MDSHMNIILRLTPRLRNLPLWNCNNEDEAKELVELLKHFFFDSDIHGVRFSRLLLHPERITATNITKSEVEQARALCYGFSYRKGVVK